MPNDAQVHASLTSNKVISEYRSHEDWPIKYRFEHNFNSIWMDKFRLKNNIIKSSMQRLSLTINRVVRLEKENLENLKTLGHRFNQINPM